MKKNDLFEQCLANVDPEVKEEVRLNMEKEWTQRHFATLLGKLWKKVRMCKIPSDF